MSDYRCSKCGEQVSRKDAALRKIAFECDNGEHTAIALEALGADETYRSGERRERWGAAPWEVLKDPARPNWPGLLLVDAKHEVVIPVVTGNPQNRADSAALADRLAADLNATARTCRRRTP